MSLDPQARRMVDQVLRAQGAVEASSDPDQDWAEMLESMRGSGVDLSQPQPVSVQIVFPHVQAMRHGGGELLVAGYPGVRAGGGPNLFVLMQIVLSVEALGQIRSNLESFAASRDGYVAEDAEGGEQVLGLNRWRGRLDQMLSPQALAAIDQDVVDEGFAWDIDPHATAWGRAAGQPLPRDPGRGGARDCRRRLGRPHPLLRHRAPLRARTLGATTR